MIADVEAASYLVDHSITVAGINPDDLLENENNDNIILIQQKIDQFNTRNTSNNQGNNDSLVAKLMSDAAEANRGNEMRSDKNMSRKVEVNLDGSQDQNTKNEQINYEIIKVEIMKVLSKINEENEDIEIDDINRYVRENNVKVLINLKD